MTVYRLHGDDSGETRLTPIQLHPIDRPADGIGRILTLGDIPATGMGVAEMVDRLPDTGIHPAPWRQFLAVLQGEYEITPTAGDKVVLQVGDVLMTDDVHTTGHYSRDCGKDSLMLLSVRIPDDWAFPGN